MKSPQTVLKTKPVIRIIVSAILFLALTIGCRVQLVPQYSPALEDEIVNDAKMTDLLYLQMVEAPPEQKRYELYSAQYISLEAEINSILFKNENRQNSQDLVASITKLKNAFVEYKDDHKNKDTLSNAQLKVYNAYLKGFWSPVLVAEQALSRAK